MELSFARQITEAAATLLAGLALGLLYEIFAALRRRSPAPVGWGLDALYCGVFAFSLFLIGMGPGRGTLRLYMPPLALAGAALWEALFGAAVHRRTEKALDAAGRLAARLREKLARCRRFLGRAAKKFEKFRKNIFSSVRKWFTIINNHATDGIRKNIRKRGVTGREAETIQYFYEDRDPGADRLRRHHAGHREKPHRRGAGGPGRAAGAGGRRAAGKRGAGI